MYEYQLEAEFVRTTMGAGLRHLGYPCIVGAGVNAATLHYESNASLIQHDDLIMVDAGAEFRYGLSIWPAHAHHAHLGCTRCTYQMQ